MKDTSNYGPRERKLCAVTNHRIDWLSQSVDRLQPLTARCFPSISVVRQTKNGDFYTLRMVSLRKSQYFFDNRPNARTESMGFFLSSRIEQFNDSFSVWTLTMKPITFQPKAKLLICQDRYLSTKYSRKSTSASNYYWLKHLSESNRTERWIKTEFEDRLWCE